MTIRAKTDAAWEQLKLSDDVRSRLERALLAGYVIVAPSEPITVDGKEICGWWEIDPATGRTLGIASRGWGQTAAEYGQRLQLIILEQKEYVCLAAAEASVLAVISPLLNVGDLGENAIDAAAVALDGLCAGAE